MTNPNDNAFPRALPQGYIHADDVDAHFWERQANGMSKREYFAAMAMQGLLSCPDTVNGWGYSEKVMTKPEDFFAVVSIMATGIANTLIARLNNESKV